MKKSLHTGSRLNEVGYNEHPAIMNRFLHIKSIVIESSAKELGYNEHPLTTNSAFRIFIFAMRGTKCIRTCVFHINNKKLVVNDYFFGFDITHCCVFVASDIDNNGHCSRWIRIHVGVW